MPTISSILKKYSGKIDFLDLELIIAHAINKKREFVLTYPEYKINDHEAESIKHEVSRRIKCEPLAYVLGEKEFYGINFKIDKNVLIPRPETEQIIELALKEILDKKNKIKNIKIIDIGTGSGNIIIAIAKQLQNSEFRISNFEFLGIDISKKALRTARQNAKLKKLDEKIKFFHGDLLSPLTGNFHRLGGIPLRRENLEIGNSTMIIVANLPYLSPKIYQSAPESVRNYEPKIALLSQKDGLSHYEKLLKQLADFRFRSITCFLEISPEQKRKIEKLIKKYFSKAKIEFYKDLSGRWRICQLEILNAKF